jgi:hypothetical protein
MNTDDLFASAQRWFSEIVDEVAKYDLSVDASLSLRRSPGLTTYYDLTERTIYLAMPSADSSLAHMYLLFARTILGYDTDDQVLEFMSALTPWTVAHELAHYFRHREGLFDTTNLWYEEQVANVLASALTRKRLSPSPRAEIRLLVGRALDRLASDEKTKPLAADTYLTFAEGLYSTGELSGAVLDRLFLIESLLQLSPEVALRGSGHLAQPVLERLVGRQSTIDQLNDEYAADLLRYAQFQAGWFWCDLGGTATHFVDEFRRDYLHRPAGLLARLETEDAPSFLGIVALYRAARFLSQHHPAAASYFYKRYRSLLLICLQQAAGTERLRGDLRLALDNWDGGPPDALDYVSTLAPPELRDVFPSSIEHSGAVASSQLPAELPTETDKRLFSHAAEHTKDPQARSTLDRLELLLHADIFKGLPAEALLDIAYQMYTVKFAAGATVVWRSDRDKDLYLVADGQLQVEAAEPESNPPLATLGAGEVLGEMAFFASERLSTVRATQHCECYVLRAVDLHALTFRHPALMLQLARTVTRRLAERRDTAT